MGRTVMLLGALALAFSGPASASTRHRRTRQIAPDPVVAAVRDAVAYWGVAPCGGRFTIAAGPGLPSAGDALLEAAWATWASPLAAGAPPVSYTDCAVWLSGAVWGGEQRLVRWPEFCATVTHEFGHLLGLGHDLSDTTDVMYPVIDELGRNAPAECLDDPVADYASLRFDRTHLAMWDGAEQDANAAARAHPAGLKP